MPSKSADQVIAEILNLLDILPGEINQNADWAQTIADIKTNVQDLKGRISAPTTPAKPRDSRKAEEDEVSGKTIEEFFTAVGAGARQAQAQLDVESHRYINERPAFAPETMFRIPKVSANLKLGMETTKEGAINFLIFKRGTTEKEYLEQEIAFDIVTAMPPPDAMGNLADLPLGRTIASSQEVREEAKKRLTSEQNKQRNKDDAGQKLVEIIKRISKQAEFRRTVLFKSPAQDVFLHVPKAAPDNRTPEVDAVLITAPMNDDKWTAHHVTSTTPNLRHLVVAMLPFIDRQEEILNNRKWT